MAMTKADSGLASRFAVSPNHGERLAAVDCVVLHYTGMADDASALAWLCNPQSEVSCHYCIRENGEIIQLVPESRRAWHAGRSFWAGERDMNSRSIGIEIVNPGHAGDCPPFPSMQIGAVIRLCRDIAARHTIAAQRFLAHSDIAPGRKQDPGEMFPWEQLHRHGVGHWVAPRAMGGGRTLSPGESGQPVEALQAMLAMYGYGIDISGEFDAATAAVVSAFQRHFRPARIDGIADASTIETLRDLIAHLPAPRLGT